MSNLAAFSKQFPDIPFDYNQLGIVSTNYINGSGNISDVIVFQTKLNEQIKALQIYQNNLIANTPEYTDQSASPIFLSSISTVASQSSTLQNQLSIVNENIQHMQLKAGGNMSAITFYVYTTITIVIGILCILLITYLVYMYMDPSSSMYNSSMRGGKRNPV